MTERDWFDYMAERNERAKRLALRRRGKVPFWRADAFWIVLLPTALVGGVFALAWVFRWIG